MGPPSGAPPKGSKKGHQFFPCCRTVFWVRGRPSLRRTLRGKLRGGEPDRMILSRLDRARERGVFVVPQGKMEEDCHGIAGSGLDTPVGRSE